MGRLVADRLGAELCDTDAEVAALAGMAVADVFVVAGEDRFRSLEREAVGRALREHRGVVAVGGGAVLDPDVRALLHGHPVVFLSVGGADAVRRVGLARDRPAALGSPRAQLIALLRERQPLYAGVATATVDTDGRSPAEVAEAVLSVLSGAG